MNTTTQPTTISHYICVWPDGMYCDPDELESMSHRGDDYAKVAVGPNQVDWEVADAYAARINSHVSKSCS